jgi:predicted helicase
MMSGRRRKPSRGAGAFARFMPLGAESADDRAPAIFELVCGAGAAGAWPDVANAAILLPATAGGAKKWGCFAAAGRGETALAFADGRVLPFWVCDADGQRRRENISDWAVDQFRARYGNPVLSKWSVFDYVYGVLHHAGYRAAFADEFGRGLPRIPFAPDFRAFQRAGQRLLELHVNYQSAEPYPLAATAVPKRRGAANRAPAISGIPAEASAYRLAGRSAVDRAIERWPEPGDPAEFARQVGRVVTVSLETIKVVGALPAEFC